ncbi:MAG: aa3-type cytochrome c oxidase subunit IV [Pseudomonadota bacterium]
MSGNVDAQELRRHQADFHGFVRFITIVIVLVIVILGGMAIFLL